jgi:hypothetical protein
MNGILRRIPFVYTQRQVGSKHKARVTVNLGGRHAEVLGGLIKATDCSITTEVSNSDADYTE